MDGPAWKAPELTQLADPEYKQVGSTASDEFLVSFGEASYDPKTRCVGEVPVFGGKRATGHL